MTTTEFTSGLEPSFICHCKSPCTDNTLQQAGEILMKLVCGEFAPDHTEDAVEDISALLRRYYGKKRGKC